VVTEPVGPVSFPRGMAAGGGQCVWTSQALLTGNPLLLQMVVVGLSVEKQADFPATSLSTCP
jgi:hypothetical protein